MAQQRPKKSGRVEVRKGERGDELVVDGLVRRHGVLRNGQYFLREYAYDPADTLAELGEKYAAYLDRAADARAARREG